MNSVEFENNNGKEAIITVGGHIIGTIGCAMELILNHQFTNEQRAKINPEMILCVNADGVTLGTIENTIKKFIDKYVIDITFGKVKLSTMVQEIEALTMEYHGDELDG